MEAVRWLLYGLGVVLHLALQIQNSIRSNSNGLSKGWSGVTTWLKLNGLSVGVRLFFSVIFFPAFAGPQVTRLGDALASAGFPIPSWSLAGIAGYTVDSFLNQITALIPGLKAEMPLLVPPPTAVTLPSPSIEPRVFPS